jgi:hypothetical protein
MGKCQNSPLSEFSPRQIPPTASETGNPNQLLLDKQFKPANGKRLEARKRLKVRERLEIRKCGVIFPKFLWTFAL